MDFKVQNKETTINQLINSDIPVFSKTLFSLLHLAPTTLSFLDETASKGTERSYLDVGFTSFVHLATIENTIDTNLRDFGDGGLKIISNHYTKHKIDEINALFTRYGLPDISINGDIIKNLYDIKLNNYEIMKEQMKKLDFSGNNHSINIESAGKPLGIKGDFKNAYTYGSIIAFLKGNNPNPGDVDGGQILESLPLEDFRSKTKEKKVFLDLPYVPNLVPEKYQREHLYFANGINSNTIFERPINITKPSRQYQTALFEIQLIQNIIKQRKMLVKPDEELEYMMRFTKNKIKSKIKVSDTYTKDLISHGFTGFEKSPVTKHDFNISMQPDEVRTKIAESSLHMEYLLKRFVHQYGSNLK